MLRLVPDAIRYTFCFPQETYTRGYYDIKERLQNQASKIIEYFRERWGPFGQPLDP